MSESPSESDFSWQDIQPVLPLFVTVLVVQVIGAAVNFWVAPFPNGFDNLWLGAALCTFPGYLAGLPVQAQVRAHSIQENKGMVAKMGFVALGLTVAAVVFPEFGLIHVL